MDTDTLSGNIWGLIYNLEGLPYLLRQSLDVLLMQKLDLLKKVRQRFQFAFKAIIEIYIGVAPRYRFRPSSVHSVCPTYRPMIFDYERSGQLPCGKLT